MATQAVAKRESQVPDLVPTPALQITAEDVALPRIYLGQFMTKAVQEQLVKPGCVFSATSQDDPDPQVLWSPETKGDEGVLFHVIALRKGKSISEGGELLLYDYDDPAAPEDAWVTYNYTVVLPDYDNDVPYKLLLTRTGRPAALQINTVLKKNSIAGPAWHSAFRLTAAERENTKGKFFVARVKAVEAQPAGTELAESLALLVAAAPQAQAAAPSNEPAI